jgi:hypothetical protein
VSARTQVWTSQDDLRESRKSVALSGTLNYARLIPVTPEGKCPYGRSYATKAGDPLRGV